MFCKKSHIWANNWENGGFPFHFERQWRRSPSVRFILPASDYQRKPDWRRSRSLALYHVVFQKMEISVFGAQNVKLQRDLTEDIDIVVPSLRMPSRSGSTEWSWSHRNILRAPMPSIAAKRRHFETHSWSTVEYVRQSVTVNVMSWIHKYNYVEYSEKYCWCCWTYFVLVPHAFLSWNFIG